MEILVGSDSLNQPEIFCIMHHIIILCTVKWSLKLALIEGLALSVLF